MDFLNKTYKNRITGDTFTIIDVYQNVAITSDKEKINTALLNNDKLFIPVSGFVNEGVSPNLREDVIEPSKFFDNQGTYNVFAEKIKSLPLDNVPYDQSMSSNTKNNTTDNNESAIIMSDPEDEVQELKRKYGITSVDDSVRKQNETFARILDPQEDQPTPVQVNNVKQIEEYIEPNQTYVEQPVQKIEVQDPIITMFKNVKRNLEFKINLKIDGKIPRLDFIEMMEDSYEISIIEFLADEFTNKLLKDPSLIRNKIIDEIKTMIDKKNDSPSKVKKPEVQEVIKPLPPPTQIIREGENPEGENPKTRKSSTRRTTYKKNTQES